MRGGITLSKPWKTSEDGWWMVVSTLHLVCWVVVVVGGGVVDGREHGAPAAVREDRHLLHDHWLG